MRDRELIGPDLSSALVAGLLPTFLGIFHRHAQDLACGRIDDHVDLLPVTAERDDPGAASFKITAFG